jgi:hypothetical protein
MKGIPMDVAGAMSLQKRLEQQEHWRQADAVREGRQLPVDPDGDELAELGDGIRVYSVRRTANEIHQMCKRLIDGRWQHGTIDESPRHLST